MLLGQSASECVKFPRKTLVHALTTRTARTEPIKFLLIFVCMSVAFSTIGLYTVNAPGPSFHSQLSSTMRAPNKEDEHRCYRRKGPDKTYSISRTLDPAAPLFLTRGNLTTTRENRANFPLLECEFRGFTLHSLCKFEHTNGPSHLRSPFPFGLQ
jgi:hypothetical protein